MLATKQNHPHHQYDVGIHSLKTVENVQKLAREASVDKKDFSVMTWAAMLHDVGKPQCLTVDEKGITHFYNHPAEGKELARKILRRLRFDNYTIDFVCHLIQYHDVQFSLKKNKMRKWMNLIGTEKMPYLFLLIKGDKLAQSLYQREEKMEKLAAAQALYREIVEDKECVDLKMLAVNGGDLISIGFPKGKCMGEMLHSLLELVLEKPEQNTKENLLAIAKQNIPREDAHR